MSHHHEMSSKFVFSMLLFESASLDALSLLCFLENPFARSSNLRMRVVSFKFATIDRALVIQLSWRELDKVIE